ncbi:hypothetical protein IW140_002229 [Coemansia sp. RSA 1813]|nr:hypothetical protein EV178_001737 [Coemansia sp. RSA 1646]KAJ1770514.1 hypothetical protein LPJ74_003117 [Coemansia sp. RSA 1843]KAJ2092949.1 hypothetical protein IW138_000663 [Coemansia sp. RSA 986]KAJ2216270.1 hypothetical protein EV179_001509 [Coemansia sp. RSA 487]KAJ2570558.1 hypothetical protein IW140_002229 [Coemansia sp. RSA 1813]
MPNTPMPANIRKRSETYAQNINKRGHVKKSLDPKVEQRLEAERLRKKGLGKGNPILVSSSRKILLVLLTLVLGSTLYQVFLPLFGNNGSSSSSSHRSNKKGASKQEPELTREQQARAAEAVLRAMNQQKIEKYRENAKNYKGEAVVGPEDDDFVSVLLAVSPDSHEEAPAVKAKPQFV